MIKLSPRDQRTVLIVSGLAVGTLWLYAAFIVGPLMREVGKLRRQVSEARAELQALELSTARVAELRTQHLRLDRAVALLHRFLPSEEELPQVIELISGFASQSQVKIQRIAPIRTTDATETAAPGATPDEPPVVYKSVPIKVDALSGFHQLGTFLSLVETSGKPMEISSLRIWTDPRELKRVNTTLIIRSFVVTRPSEETGGATR